MLMNGKKQLKLMQYKNKITKQSSLAATLLE
jgi:hypothetical protein